MRILFVLENYYPHVGGVEIVFKNLCERLAKNHDVTVLTRQLPGTTKKEVRNGVRILRIGSFNSRYLFTLRAIPKVWKLAKHADVIHTTTYNAAFPAWFAARLRRKPVLLTVHETWLGHWREYSDFSAPVAWLHGLFEWFLYRFTFDMYACVSNSTRRALLEALPRKKKKIRTIYNGFNPRIWKENRGENARKIREGLALQGKFVLLASGRPGTSKGFPVLLNAFPLVKKEVPNAVLLLLLSTDKQYVHKIEEFKKQAGSDVIFVKQQPYERLPSFRQMADCYVVPSLSEGFGYTVLESGASGKPIVASNAGSIPEVIYGKYVLVKPNNPEALAKGIIQVFKGEYKEKPEKEFPWTETVRAYESAYVELSQ